MPKKQIWLFVKSKPWSTTSDETLARDLAQMEKGGIDTRGATVYEVDELGIGRTFDAKRYAKSQKKHKHWWNRD